MIESLINKVADADEWMREHKPTVEWFGVGMQNHGVRIQMQNIAELPDDDEAVLWNGADFHGTGFRKRCAIYELFWWTRYLLRMYRRRIAWNRRICGLVSVVDTLR